MVACKIQCVSTEGFRELKWGISDNISWRSSFQSQKIWFAANRGAIPNGQTEVLNRIQRLKYPLRRAIGITLNARVF